jgi:tRNA threonylcarbamoyladenosine biosynthesis protein TsaB
MNLLAFDTSTDTLPSPQRGDAVWQHTRRRGAQASAALIPPSSGCWLRGWALTRSTPSCSAAGPAPSPGCGLPAAWGLAFGARNGQGTPVLPVDTLLAVAEEARHQHGCTQVLAVLDARMNEVYSAHCTWQEATRQWSTDADFGLSAPKR